MLVIFLNYSILTHNILLMQMDNNTFTYNLTHHLPYVFIALDWDNLKPNKFDITQAWMLVISTTYE
jgi:hypothetical protein